MRVIRTPHQPRAIRRIVAAAVATASLAGAGVLAAPSAWATPVFQAPFACGETWRGATYQGHNDPQSIDFNWGAGKDDNGRPVRASAPGKVVGSGVYRDGVSYVLIDHGSGWQTRYLHMQTGSLISAGTTVRTGDVVGKVGDVGSNGQYHLHYEQRLNGEIVASKFNGVAFAYPEQKITSRNCGNTAPAGAAFGDFDGDGKADVLARDSASNDLLLYKGAGNGTFKTNSRAGTGWGALNAIVRHGDFDGDGHEDVIAREAGTGNLNLYRGTGDGSFKTGSTRIGTGWGTYTPVAAGDFDKDGKSDLLGRNDATGALNLYRGNGDGTLKPGSTQIGTGWGGYDLLTGTGDFDGDGNADVLARETATGRLHLYRGDGEGGFKSGSTEVGSGWGGIDATVGVGDFDGDGKNDLIAREASTGKLHLYRGDGQGGFKSGSTQIGTGWTGYNPLA